MALGHTRLAIQDLSVSGSQPMVSSCGRYVVVFNGEIYNHFLLRSSLNNELGSHSWAGNSDTETLLTALIHWGVEKTLSKLSGMFAFAFWDSEQKKLVLARDRMGEKPLYYGWVGDNFLFASELKALKCHPHFANKVSHTALAQYLRFTYIPAPYSIWHGIYKLEPGCLLEIEGAAPPAAPATSLRPGQSYENLRLKRYWSVKEQANRAAQNPITDDRVAKQELRNSLSKSVEEQLISDVPLGAFLSGGVDSSAIVASMQAMSSSPVKTFTIGFDDPQFDESAHARAVAAHIGTEHTEVTVAEKDALAVIPLLPDLYDEPFADSSQIPTYLVSKIAKQSVTVALSGDGGDELFGGYNRYYWNDQIWKFVNPLPFSLRKSLGACAKGMSVGTWDGLSRLAGRSPLGDKIHKMADRLLTVESEDDLYLSLVSEWSSPQSILKKGIEADASLPAFMSDTLPATALSDPALKMMFWDTGTYLPDDILCKVDRAAMGVSLETRVPLLHQDIITLAWRLPLHMKKRGNSSKWLLRQVLYDYVPKELIERPKAGFGIPVGKWLRTELRDWAEQLLCEQRLEQEGFFYPQPIRTMWQEHLSGIRDWTPKLWTILMFQEWWAAQGR